MRDIRVFLSYRRADVGGYAGRLGDALVRHLGARSVFQDVTAIGPGQDFVLAIDRALDDSDVVLAVIGPGWLTASTPTRASRLSEADDFVRMELSRALERGVPVVPVLVGGADLPKAADLPSDLRELSQRQAVVLHDPTWHQDVEGLVRSLRGESPVPTGPQRRWLIGPAVAIVLAMTAGVVWWRSTVTTESETTDTGGYVDSEDDKPACPAPTGGDWQSIQLSDDPAAVVEFPDGALTFTVRAAHWTELEPKKWQVTLDMEMKNERREPMQQGSWYYRKLIVAQRAFGMNCMGVTDLRYVEPGLVGDGRVGFEVTCEPVGAIELIVDESISPPGKIDVAATSEPAVCLSEAMP